jgi:hypothetical protein
MWKRCLTISALLLASTVPDAQSGLTFADGPSSYNRRYSATVHQYFDAPMRGQAYDRIFYNENDCAPDRATPDWGAGSALLGYSCVAPSAN